MCGQEKSWPFCVCCFEGRPAEGNRQLRRGNVGRRWLYLWRLYSGEAAGVGGNHLVGCSPPAEEQLTGGNHQPR